MSSRSRKKMATIASIFKNDTYGLLGPQLAATIIEDHPHRFQGLSENFTFAIHGPAEQSINLLAHLDSNDRSDIPGLLYKAPDDIIIQNPPIGWDDTYLIFDLAELLREDARLDDRLTQIDLTLRADYFLAGINRLREALVVAGEQDINIRLCSIGFESFDDTILRNFIVYIA